MLMTKTKLFESYEKMIVGRLMFLSHSNLFYIHVTFSAKKGIFMNCKQKTGQKSLP